MLSLPEDWDYTLAGLSQINRESIDAIRTAVWELEKAGHIKRQQGRDEKGKMTAIEYTICAGTAAQGNTYPAAKPAHTPQESGADGARRKDNGLSSKAGRRNFKTSSTSWSGGCCAAGRLKERGCGKNTGR